MKKGTTRRRPAMTRFAPPVPSTKVAFFGVPILNSVHETLNLNELYRRFVDESGTPPPGEPPADVLAEILPRLPYRSLCRFKCVSKPWLVLCSDPDIRKRSSQTLSGFFFTGRGRLSFRNLSGRGPPMVDPSLPFLRRSYDRFNVERCCGGLLLCRCWKSNKYDYDYVVCNPMTGQWTVLPPIPPQDQDSFVSGYFAPMEMLLGFDPAVPSCFTVFAPLTNCGYNEFTEMLIYSSKTGRWITVEADQTTPDVNSKCVFLNGTMHFVTNNSSIVTVDAEGEDWGQIYMPKDMSSRRSSRKVSIGQSRGRLHAWQIIDNNDDDDGYGDAHLYVWVLKDYIRGKWILKHDAPVSELFGRERGEDDFSYTAFAIHPHSNCIFLTDKEEMAVSYDMDSQKASVICSSKEVSEDVLPYVPCLAEWSSDCHTESHSSSCA